MKHRFTGPVSGIPRASLSLALVLLTASAALAADSTRVGDQTRDKGRNGTAVDFNKWAGNAPKDIGQADINQPTKVKAWSPREIAAAKADLARARATNSALDAKLAANPSNVPDDLHPVWYVEWLKLQSDVTAQFIKPPPNKIMIVDQDRLSKMTEAEKKDLKVRYRTTTICERTVSYKPIYKTIEVAYPG